MGKFKELDIERVNLDREESANMNELELFIIGISEGAITIAVNDELKGLVDLDTFMTDDELNAIGTIVDRIVERVVNS